MQGRDLLRAGIGPRNRLGVKSWIDQGQKDFGGFEFTFTPHQRIFGLRKQVEQVKRHVGRIANHDKPFGKHRAGLTDTGRVGDGKRRCMRGSGKDRAIYGQA
jgi:hypothetical protein